MIREIKEMEDTVYKLKKSKRGKKREVEKGEREVIVKGTRGREESQ
jgi:hypothetical protein